METQELTATSIVALFQTTKSERASFVSGIINAIDNGELDPLKLHLQVKCMQDIINQLTGAKPYENSVNAKKYKDAVLDKAQKQGAKSFDFMASKIEIKEVGTKYDYSKCGDPVYARLKEESDKAAEKLKERETFVKAIPTGGATITDEESGESVTCYPPIKSSTTAVAVTLK